MQCAKDWEETAATLSNTGCYDTPNTLDHLGATATFASWCVE
jgi:hypothetical protein